MASPINLHTKTNDFIALIKFTAAHFNIIPAFVEKDYWITLALRRLSDSVHAGNAVFKGGTSLSKGYHIINRFSEDIDIAIINENLSGNALKTKIRSMEKDITSGLREIVAEGITSKGSMFRKSIFEYPTALQGTVDNIIPNRLIVEINSFTNPDPNIKQEIASTIAEYLTATNQTATIDEYGLQPFLLNILDKRRTMVEKLVSLFRFSFAENPRRMLATKIRHFYDLYYLASDAECASYIQTAYFKADFAELFTHDKQQFDTPVDWQKHDISQSPLVTDFPVLWNSLRDTYLSELPKLAFMPVPAENKVAKIFTQMVEQLINTSTF
ncbi:MAG: nucleotidyl transferase AbiEii/AbiGii toxin family protein [Prevotellaceae bacterium]|jgi:predicted nucleotidyltransferase component of viral defense system|nr:nucleotidyl transferase AbiEii/AbiGii toxin family protein [Prevotellaceae bacterium]